MGKFDGYLICSDLDGTFRGGKPESIERNIEAVRYFTENGGRFCFATGRTVEYLKEYQLAPMANAPCCLCNGGLLYDYQKEAVVKENRVPFTVGAFIEIATQIEGISEGFYFNIYPNEQLRYVTFAEAGNLPQEALEGYPIKMILVAETEKDANALKAKLDEHPFFANCYISKSWAEGVEINSETGTKGYAIRYIKESLGNIHTAIGIGDHENDIPLLVAADIGVAVGNALDEVKAKADLIVKHCDESSICDLIKIIEKDIKKACSK